MTFRILMSLGMLLLSMGCGVKGDPLPPEKPASLGRGRPTFKKAVRDVEPVSVDEKSEQSEGGR